MTSVLLMIALAAEPAWKKIDSTDGVEMFSRELPGERLVELKVTAVSKLSVEALCTSAFGKATIAANEPGVKVRKLILEKPNERVTYEQVSAPVVSDRDYAVRAIKEPGADGSCRVRFTTANDLAPPLPKGFVRIEKLTGTWELLPLPDGSTRATYVIFTDPGGSIPAMFIEGTRRSTAIDWFKLVLERAKAKP